MIANGHVNGPRPTFRYPMPSRLYEGRPDGRFVDISHQAGPPWDVPRVGRGLAAGDLDNDGRLDAVIVAQDGPLAYFHNRTRRAGQLRDAPARGDQIQPRRRRGPGHGHGRRPSPGRPAHRRRELPVRQRPSPPLRTRPERPRRAGRGPLALGQDRSLAIPPRRDRLRIDRGESDSPSPGRIRSKRDPRSGLTHAEGGAVITFAQSPLPRNRNGIGRSIRFWIATSSHLRPHRLQDPTQPPLQPRQAARRTPRRSWRPRPQGPDDHPDEQPPFV